MNQMNQMAQKNACCSTADKSNSQGATIRYFAVLLLLLAFLIPTMSSAQNEVEYDEISVFFSVPRIGGIDLSAVIREEVLYLPVTDVFGFLKIKNTFSPGFDSISGFFINQQAAYLIDRLNNRIIYQQKIFDLKPGDLIRTETNLYLKSTYFGEIFGLQCSFSFRSLSVSLNTKIELPVIREMRQEQMRKNISQIKGEIKADTTVKRSYPLFHFGMADWSLISTQQLDGPTDARLGLTLGTIIAGGEANITLNYNKNSPFSERDQYYLWRYANNDHKALRQVSLGKISSNAISSLNSPIVGVQLTNTPTTFRQSFGTYTLSDVTEPGWLVELYVNNVLVDYKKADASGFFTFEVPMVYGNSGVKLQFYGPWGEERSKEQNISIPFNFLPVGDFEYMVSAGIVEDSLSSRFSRANFDYGVTRRLTVGGGVEYLSTLSSGKIMPFVSTSLRLASSLLLSGEYTYGVRLKGVLNYRLPSDIQLEINYTKYDKDQKAINTNYLEERKVAISVPFRSSNFGIFSRLSLNQIIMPLSKYTSAELLLSGSVFGVNTNLTTNALFPDHGQSNVYSNLSLSFRLPGAFILTPQAQFDYTKKAFVSIKCGIEKHLFKNGFLNFSYDQNFISKYNSIELGFRYDFSFAQMGVSARRSSGVTTFVESASGSLMVDAKTKFIGANSRESVGKGGMTLYPFLDMNCNSKRDPNEPKVFGLQVHINGGRIEFNEKDTTIRVFDLEPYTNYLVTLDGANFDNIAWQMRQKTISVAISPNQLKMIEVPIAVAGEAAGTVYLVGKSGKKGQGRIIVNFYRSDSSLAASTLTEADGYFSYLGLSPGEYTAAIDTLQLNKLDMSASPSSIPFTISPSVDGDVADGFEFVLKSEKPEIPVTVQPEVEPKVIEKVSAAKDTVVFTPVSAFYKVQLLALPKPLKVKNYFSQLLLDLPEIKIIETLEADGYYRYSTQVFKNMAEAIKYQRILRNKGWTDCFIPINRAKKQ